MCGLSGFVTPSGFENTNASATLQLMTEEIKHRGPDDHGQWIDPENGIAIGHRRLAIIDLTKAGHQPMESERFVIAFNGEIYNHLELRTRLGDKYWTGHSDTETLLWGIQEWGLRMTLQACVGMFSLVLWDKKERKLSLARDRAGEKPLYYGWQGKTFLFGSELKALQRHPDFKSDIDRQTLELYIRRGYVPAPFSIFSGIKKLTPGTILEISPDRLDDGSTKPEHYWSLRNFLEDNSQKLDISPDEGVKELEALLLSSIKGQLLSDVPLGAFLSGGIDSSLIVSLMQSVSTKPVKTFTIGFDEKGYNEATHARLVADHLNTDHTELYITGKDGLELVPSLPEVFDEPFADPSQIPTILVSRLARQHVTVALSGDGGDELFCGYGRYSETVRRWNSLSRVPLSIRSALKHFIPKKFAEGIAASSVDSLYQYVNAQWKGFPNLVLGSQSSSYETSLHDSLPDAKERMMYYDTMTYLPDDILVKVDRAAMSTSLETRVPMLDHRVIEFAWKMMIDVKDKDGIEKWPLKQILYKYVPESIVNRPKMGFGVPIEHWLRGPLRDWAEDLLSVERLNSDGLFDTRAIRKNLEEHLSGKYNRHYGLWTILMFQAWYKKNKFFKEL